MAPAATTTIAVDPRVDAVDTLDVAELQRAWQGAAPAATTTTCGARS